MEKLFRLAQVIDRDELVPPEVDANQDTLNTILTIAFSVIGAVAVLFMVIAGVRYITSQGDPAKMTAAKNQILYTAIGLILAVMSGIIVNYVIGRT